MSQKEYEYVIIGSGVAASTVSMRILEHNRAASILILEAGPKVEAKNRRSWWDYVVQANGKEYKSYDFTTDQAGEYESVGSTMTMVNGELVKENLEFYVPGSRVMLYGGSTVHWGGWSPRYKREDFKLFTNTKKGGDWPFPYDDLTPYYEQAEMHLSVCGDHEEPWNKEMGMTKPYPVPPYHFTEADGEMYNAFGRVTVDPWGKPIQGILPGKMPVARYRQCVTTGTCKYCPVGGRFSGQQILDELLNDSRNINFEVRTNSPVNKVLVDSKRRASGVEFIDAKSGDIMTAMAGTVVVCAGAYESPKLLMLSKSRYWKNGIGNDYDQVGRYAVSHSMLKVRGEKNGNKERWFQEYDFPTLMSRTFDTEEYQCRNKIFLFKNRALPNIDLAALMIAGMTRKQIDAKLIASRQIEVQAFMEEMGRPENRLTLLPGKNRFGLPKMKIEFHRTAEADSNGRKWLDMMEKIVLDMGYDIIPNKKIIQPPGGHHLTGTCRMSETPELGVTDLNMRVHDVDNLYICSNAAFPTGSAVNPTLTLTAMAFRLADHLAS